ncbi:nuclear transport factor 2 family protein [Pseudonocardiaceae bacterium YIM PH 21723]|nr:nuclear transport factor 2 family protein [Pseudonocardiaceae bacterium YIM PH 21723]
MRGSELFRHSMDLMLAKDIQSWLDLWAEDGVMEFPFAPPGWPTRLEGRSAIADYMRDYPDHIDLHEIQFLHLHQTTDPDTVVAETRGLGRILATGAPFDMTYIVVATTRDGLFTGYRDYWSPLAVEQPGVRFVR